MCLSTGILFELRTVIARPINGKILLGEPIDDVRRDYMHEHPLDVDVFDRYVDGFEKSITGGISGMRDLIRDLKIIGIRVAGLSNWLAELYHYSTDTLDIVDELEDVIVSGHVMMRKPEIEIC